VPGVRGGEFYPAVFGEFVPAACGEFSTAGDSCSPTWRGSTTGGDGILLWGTCPRKSSRGGGQRIPNLSVLPCLLKRGKSTLSPRRPPPGRFPFLRRLGTPGTHRRRRRSPGVGQGSALDGTRTTWRGCRGGSRRGARAWAWGRRSPRSRGGVLPLWKHAAASACNQEKSRDRGHEPLSGPLLHLTVAAAVRGPAGGSTT
jgi:hypothetical protein